jgi:predicted small secreted protein
MVIPLPPLPLHSCCRSRHARPLQPAVTDAAALLSLLLAGCPELAYYQRITVMIIVVVLCAVVCQGRHAEPCLMSACPQPPC